MKTVAIDRDYVMYYSAINMINILSATMILVSRNIKYMQIFAGVPSARGRRRQVQYA